jgi:fused signal recognition particle receptor
MYKKLSLFSVLLVFGVLLLSAYMRASDAGLGCPEWPGCYGRIITDALPAVHGLENVAAAEDHARWKSIALRSLAAALSVSVLLLVIASAWLRQRRGEALLLSLIALLLTGLQFSLGFWAARWLPAPLVLSLHGLLGLLALSVLYGLYLLQRPAAEETGLTRISVLHGLAQAGLLALLVEIVLGGLVSSQHAGLACPDFPTCMGSFNPSVDYATAFSLPDPGAQGGILSQPARAAIHWVHRIGAILVFVLLSLLALAISSNQAVGRLSKAGVLLNFLLLLQIGLGVAGVLLRLPIAIVVAHAAVALLLWLAVLHIVFYLRLRAPESAMPLAPPKEAVPPIAPETGENLFVRLRGGLGKTRHGLAGFLGALGQKKIDRDLLDDIEAQLLMSDMGVTVTQEVVSELTQGLERSLLGDADALTARLREQLYQILSPCSIPLEITKTGKPFVILVVGVNGVGKTTTIGKLANHLKARGLQVMLAAGDTFRAAAVEQLQTWGERNQVPVIAQGSGADSASVIFDGLQAAQARGMDVLIADTAGRLHTKSHLMEELSKIKRIMARLDPDAPHEVLLVLDAGTGQNAISQARLFNEAVGLTGLVITKLDGTAKGGIVFALARQFGIPIRFIGVGEGMEDLQDFDAHAFIHALFER